MHMSKKSIAAALLILAGTGAAAREATVRGAGGERIPATKVERADLGEPMMRIRLRGGQTNLLFFRPGGRAELYVNRSRAVVAGSYDVDGQRMCLELPVRGRDCWPYDESAVKGLTATLMSDRGQKVEVTYLASPAEVAAGREPRRS